MLRAQLEDCRQVNHKYPCYSQYVMLPSALITISVTTGFLIICMAERFDYAASNHVAMIL